MKAKSALDTPMMKQYLAIKQSQPDAVVFYRMGDFYELFLDDARQAAPLLDITLTTRDKGKPDAVPMCGVPVHSAETYIKRLTDLGHRVAICEQVEAPPQAGKRLVRREVVEVITPGLAGDPAGLESRSEVTVAAITGPPDCARWALASLDVSTGNFRTTALAPGGSRQRALLLEELQRIGPREILLQDSQKELHGAVLAECLPGAALRVVDDHLFDPARVPVQPEGFEPDSTDPEMRAAAALLAYLGLNQPAALEHAPRLRGYQLAESMILDAATRTHLELFENAEDRGRNHTLLDQLDDASTPLGSRRLARWLRYPLIDPDRIAERQDAVEALALRDRMRGRLRELLKPVRDLERLLGSAIRPHATPKDLGALRDALAALGPVATEIESEKAGETASPPGKSPMALPCPERQDAIVDHLERALVDEPPAIARGSRGANETDYIREGFRPDLDELREGARRGRQWIAELEESERDRTEIASLKVRFHPVHGYSLEVPKTQLSRVPSHYERKQTLAQVERFTTADLRKIEADVLGAHDKAAALEREIFASLREETIGHASAIRSAADAVSNLDALASLAEVGRRRAWVRPEVHADEGLEILAGRHPVVEETFQGADADAFVPNDCELGPDGIQMLLITGPNMSGKSTYLRQVALITLMAQMGSWVPAERARVGIVDRIFTRVGASDRLARGESTFMVEMRETAEILEHASRRSLVILDEIGRGTSTYDGLAIAWSVLEYLHDTPDLTPRTLFATHYHELTSVAERKSRLRNAHFEAREWGEDVVFLRQLLPGGASRSYGIQVAKLAGLPATVIEHARTILRALEADSRDELLPKSPDDTASQLTLAMEERSPRTSEHERDILEALRTTQPDQTTPFEALALLNEWVSRLSKEDHR